jgi:hypothetical protein
MTILYCRLLDLREEYFTGMTDEELGNFYALLEVDKLYSSDDLISMMSAFYDIE